MNTKKILELKEKLAYARLPRKLGEMNWYKSLRNDREFSNPFSSQDMSLWCTIREYENLLEKHGKGAEALKKWRKKLRKNAMLRKQINASPVKKELQDSDRKFREAMRIHNEVISEIIAYPESSE